MVLDKETLVREKYRITRLIGDGGMGAVYEAEHLILKIPVALKFLHAELAERPGLAERFLREARVSATIQSPHVTRVTDVDKTDAGRPFLVMELLRGRSLQDLLDERQSLPEQTCIDYTLQILSGLEAAHALGVVHRDLKPDNVFITETPSGIVLKLIDFGIAKLRDSEEFKQTLTRAGAMMGTPEYMAPEQLYSAATVDGRADLFSLGVLLYEMLSGHRPVEGDEATEIVGRFVAGEVVPLRKYLPGAPNELDRIVHKAIATLPEDRFDSAYAMRVALAPLARDISQAGRLAATAPEPGGQASHAAAIPPNASVGGDDRASSIPDTLPPDESVTSHTEDDPAFPQGTGTQSAAAPIDPQARAHASAMAPPPSPVAQRAAAAFKVQSAAVPKSPPRARRGPSKLLVTTLLLILLGIGGTMVILILDHRGSDDPAPTPDFAGPPPLRTIEAEVGTSGPVPEATPTTPRDNAPVTAPPQPPPRTPNRPTTPAPSGNPASTPLPFPSSLPPLPSSLPPLPSGFPTALPSFFPPLPGFTPPNAPANAQDAGN